jgi:hypothetical protein
MRRVCKRLRRGQGGTGRDGEIFVQLRLWTLYADVFAASRVVRRATHKMFWLDLVFQRPCAVI